MSYGAPEGSIPAQGLFDSSYDGQLSKGELRGGLGRLVDGETGADNFRLDIGYGKGSSLSLFCSIAPDRISSCILFYVCR